MTREMHGIVEGSPECSKRRPGTSNVLVFHYIEGWKRAREAP